MIGDYNVFFEFDSTHHSTVKFCDDSTVNVKDRGNALFTCKTGEHLTLTRVNYIPQLTTNIINLRKLDDNGLEVV